jgi:endonuclease/exonuclease/phosphatase family metal-dependent hydrolase
MKKLRLVAKNIRPVYGPITTVPRFDPALDAGLSLNIMSFNIRRGTAKDGRNHWVFRQNLVHEMLKQYCPDVLGLQEAMDFQITALHRMLPGYEMVGVGNLGGSKGMHTAIFFNVARFSLSDEGTLWLSDTPDIPGSKGWGNILPRTCTWARLVERNSGQAFYFYNTHLDHISLRSRKKSVVFLAQRIHTRSFPDPFVLVGDFNARERSAPIRFLKGKAYLKTKAKIRGLNPTPLLDTFRLQHPDYRNVVTFHGFRRFAFRFRLDYIFVPPSIRVQDAKIIKLRWKKRFPSDHFPLMARIVIPESFADSNSNYCPEEMISAPEVQ